jgi:hypothetical protein
MYRVFTEKVSTSSNIYFGKTVRKYKDVTVKLCVWQFMEARCVSPFCHAANVDAAVHLLFTLVQTCDKRCTAASTFAVWQIGRALSHCCSLMWYESLLARCKNVHGVSPVCMQNSHSEYYYTKHLSHKTLVHAFLLWRHRYYNLVTAILGEITCSFFFFYLWCNSPPPPPPVDQGLLIHKVFRSHTMRHHSR